MTQNQAVAEAAKSGKVYVTDEQVVAQLRQSIAQVNLKPLMMV